MLLLLLQLLPDAACLLVVVVIIGVPLAIEAGAGGSRRTARYVLWDLAFSIGAGVIRFGNHEFRDLVERAWFLAPPAVLGGVVLFALGIGGCALRARVPQEVLPLRRQWLSRLLVGVLVVTMPLCLGVLARCALEQHGYGYLRSLGCILIPDWEVRRAWASGVLVVGIPAYLGGLAQWPSLLDEALRRRSV